jgi:hypothetical protein
VIDFDEATHSLSLSFLCRSPRRRGDAVRRHLFGLKADRTHRRRQRRTKDLVTSRTLHVPDRILHKQKSDRKVRGKAAVRERKRIVLRSNFLVVPYFSLDLAPCSPPFDVLLLLRCFAGKVSAHVHSGSQYSVPEHTWSAVHIHSGPLVISWHGAGTFQTSI